MKHRGKEVNTKTGIILSGGEIRYSMSPRKFTEAPAPTNANHEHNLGIEYGQNKYEATCNMKFVVLINIIMWNFFCDFFFDQKESGPYKKLKIREPLTISVRLCGNILLFDKIIAKLFMASEY